MNEIVMEEVQLTVDQSGAEGRPCGTICENSDPKSYNSDENPSTLTSTTDTSVPASHGQSSEKLKNAVSKTKFPLTACFNCDEKFRSCQDQVTEIKVGYCDDSDDDDEKVPNSSIIYIVEALYSVLSADSDVIDDIDLSQVGLCLKCAEVASQLYRHYIDLLNLSTSTSPLSQSIQQFKNWHLQNPSSTSTVLTNGNGIIQLPDRDSTISADAQNNSDNEDGPDAAGMDADEMLNQGSSEDVDSGNEAEAEESSTMEDEGNRELEEPVNIGLRKSTRERKAKQKFDPHPHGIETPPPTVSKSNSCGGSSTRSGSRNTGRSTEKRIKLDDTPKVVSGTSMKKRKSKKSVLLPRSPPKKGKDNLVKVNLAKAKPSTSPNKRSSQAPQIARSSSKNKERTTLNSISSRN